MFDIDIKLDCKEIEDYLQQAGEIKTPIREETIEEMVRRASLPFMEDLIDKVRKFEV